MMQQPPRTSYKAFLWDYDSLLTYSDDECCFSLSEREIQILLAQIEPIAWKTRYKPTETEIDVSLLEKWRGNLARKLMSGCCPDNDEIGRFGEGGVWQTSTDGGITWEDDPEGDPRNSYVGVPPLSGAAGSQKRCAAADNVRDRYRDQRDYIMSLMEAATPLIALLSGILAFIAVITGVSGAAIGISVLLMGLASALISMTPEEVEAQISDAALDEFRCLVYCRMNDNGQLTYDAWIGLLQDIASSFDAFPETFFYNTTNAFGYIGVNNAGTIGATTADDCSDCDCVEGWCYEFNFGLANGDWSSLYGTYDGTGWIGTAAGTGSSIVIYKESLPSFNITRMEIDVEYAPQGNIAVIIDDSVGTFTNIGSTTGTYVWDGDVSGTKITLNPSSGESQGAYVKMTRIRFSGGGDSPFGEDNCTPP